MFRYTAVLVAAWLFAATALAQADELRLYVLDCGHAEIADAAVLSDTGEFDGKPVQLADPCFLIRHPRGWLLWDAGLAPDAQGSANLRLTPGPALAQQLARLGITPGDVQFIAFSHLHFDHAGNANLFSRATWLMNPRELAWAEQEPAHVSMLPALFSAYHSAHTQLIDGDYDVFGDGRVRILQTPGHTPGSAVLWLDLRASGPVVLSGDLYVLRESRQFAYVPVVNADRAATLASIARVERLLKRTHARLIIQHDPRDYARLPKAPEFLQ